jgi:hypothetical protein
MSERFSPFGTGRQTGPIGEDISFRARQVPLSQEAIRAKIIAHNPVNEAALSETVQFAPAPDMPGERQDI